MNEIERGTGRSSAATTEWVPEEAAHDEPAGHETSARDWLPREPVDGGGTTPAPRGTRTNRFRRPGAEREETSEDLAERVQELEFKVAAEVEATHRAVGRGLGALTTAVEALSARLDALERRTDRDDRG
jgi:hypothetical protein